MIRRPPRSTQGVSSAASDVYKRQVLHASVVPMSGAVCPAASQIAAATDRLARNRPAENIGLLLRPLARPAFAPSQVFLGRRCAQSTQRLLHGARSLLLPRHPSFRPTISHPRTIAARHALARTPILRDNLLFRSYDYDNRHACPQFFANNVPALLLAHA